MYYIIPVACNPTPITIFKRLCFDKILRKLLSNGEKKYEKKRVLKCICDVIIVIIIFLTLNTRNRVQFNYYALI